MVSSEEKDKDLAEQLMEAGKRVMALPSSVHELLPALNQLDYCLSKVDQSPSLPILKALCLSMEALLIDDLLRHQDVDVKAYMAVCISEVTRITAPEPPYNDNQMKEFFLLIVSAFEKLADISSRSYRKRVLTLELMAKVRSCLLMVDLGCDALILDMFQYFLKSIRNNHPEAVFSSMETIMTLVLEESDNISQELLTPLLAAVEIENKSVLFIQRKLAEKVLENCASKLKPYLSLAVRTMGISVNDYSKIVSFICQGTSDPIIYRHINGPVEHTEIKGRGAEAACRRKVDLFPSTSQKVFINNGTVTFGDIGSPKSIINSEYKLDITTKSCRVEPGLDSRMAKSEIKPGIASYRRMDLEMDPKIHPVESSDHSLIDTYKEPFKWTTMTNTRKGQHKEANNLPYEERSVMEGRTMPLCSENMQELSSQTKSNVETISGSSSLMSRTLHDKTHVDRGNGNQDTDPSLPLALEGILPSDQTKKDLPLSADDISESRSQPKGTISSEVKLHDQLGRKALTRYTTNDKELSVRVKTGKESIAQRESEQEPLKCSSMDANKTPSSVKSISEKESVIRSHSEEKPTRRSSRKVGANTINEDEPSAGKQEGESKLEKGEIGTDNDVAGELSDKTVVCALKSITRSSNKQKEEPLKTSLKRKRPSVKEQISGPPHSVKDFGDNLIGSTIKVWWPLDKKFYEGVIDSFDPVKQKHKVLYLDGDKETLNLKTERWEFILDNSADRVNDIDSSGRRASSEMPPTKKIKSEPTV